EPTIRGVNNCVESKRSHSWDLAGWRFELVLAWAACLANGGSVHINKLIGAQQHMSKVAPCGFSSRLPGFDEQLVGDCKFFRPGRSAEQHLIGPMDAGSLIAGGLAEQALRQLRRLDLHKVVVEHQERLRCDRRDSS